MSDNLMARDLRNLVSRMEIRQAELNALIADALACQDYERLARYNTCLTETVRDRLALTTVLRKYHEDRTPVNHLS